MMFRAELHVHTDISDGSRTAEQILKEAGKKGLTHIAFTDHDTTLKSREHTELARKYGIRAVPAVELSAYDRSTGRKVHILGYHYKTAEHIEAIGGRTLKKRDENCKKQMRILEGLGYDVPLTQIRKISGGRCIYKQHILYWLYLSGQQPEIFGKVYREIFKNRGPCDFDIEYPEASEAVQAVKADGGYAVLAHPGQQGNFDLVEELVNAGLDGIECIHPSHGEREKRQAFHMAENYGLIATGGSDYHGIFENNGAGLGTYLSPQEAWSVFEN